MRRATRRSSSNAFCLADSDAEWRKRRFDAEVRASSAEFHE
jgi:hypothetical protein